MAVPTWIHEFQAIGSALGGIATAVIAGVGVTIARRQSIIAAQKLRLDMFPLRYGVYQSAFFAIIEVTGEANTRVPGEPPHPDTKLRKFQKKLLESRFLFDAETYEYFQKLHKELLGLKRLTGRLQQRRGAGPEDPLSVKLFDEQIEQESWLLEQLTNMAKILEVQMKVDEGASFSRKPVDKDDLQNN